MLLNFEQKDPMFLNNAGMSVEKCVQLDLNTYLNVDCYKRKSNLFWEGIFFCQTKAFTSSALAPSSGQASDSSDLPQYGVS